MNPSGNEGDHPVLSRRQLIKGAFAVSAATAIAATGVRHVVGAGEENPRELTPDLQHLSDCISVLAVESGINPYGIMTGAESYSNCVLEDIPLTFLSNLDRMLHEKGADLSNPTIDRSFLTFPFHGIAKLATSLRVSRAGTEALRPSEGVSIYDAFGGAPIDYDGNIVLIKGQDQFGLSNISLDSFENYKSGGFGARSLGGTKVQVAISMNARPICMEITHEFPRKPKGGRVSTWMRFNPIDRPILVGKRALNARVGILFGLGGIVHSNLLVMKMTQLYVFSKNTYAEANTNKQKHANVVALLKVHEMY